MSDSKWAKGLQSRLLDFPEGLLVAVLYAAACWSARQVSLDQFFLPSGIRVALLLALPLRLWPYLLLGEYAYFAHMRIPMIEDHGVTWVVLSSAYQLPAVAFVVFLHRRSIASQSDSWLLTLAGAAALVIGLTNLTLMHIFWDTPPNGGFLPIALRYVLGHYVAILTLAPLALLLARRHRVDWSRWSERPTVYAVVSLVACGWVSVMIPQDAAGERATIQLAMAAPLIALTCLQGWWGAAIGIPLMSAFVRLGTPVTGLPGSFDLDSFKIQLITALAGTALLALGSRITHFYHDNLIHIKARRQAISNARVSQFAGEQELRNRALSIRRIGDGLDACLSETIDWLRVRGHHDMASCLLDVATVHSRKFREQANMVYPTTMEHVGLYLALQTSGIGDAWDQDDRLLQPHLVGDPCCLSLDLQLTAYRALMEAVSLLLEIERGPLKIRAKCGRFQTMRGIVVTVGMANSRHHLARSTATMAVGRLSGRTQAFGGTVQCRRNRIRMFFAESVGR